MTTRAFVLLTIVIALVVIIRSRWNAWTVRRAEVAATAGALREQVLSRCLLPARAQGDPDAIRGVVMDWSLGGGLATLIAIDDGTVSLYLNPGGGVIGAGAKP